MAIRRDKFPVIDPETGLITDYIEVEWSAEAAEQGQAVAYFLPEEEERPTLGPDEYGIATHLESALPDPRSDDQ